MKWFLISVLVAVLAVVSLEAAFVTLTGETVIVETELGNVEGEKILLGETRFYYSFRGIPYAEPPVGELRLKDPVHKATWGSDVRKKFNPPVCSQWNLEYFFGGPLKIMGDEDCLYLHVYTPKPSNSDLLPVMVFIHGGGFEIGEPDPLGGNPDRMLMKDIVMVSIQYRLNSLGFLSTGDKNIPGNFGLKDQTMALQWVHDNIKYFGGNPDLVTIYGESAGGASTHYHVISPYSKGLFKRAILQSGTSLNPWALRRDHEEISQHFRDELSCPEGDNVAFLKCLQEASSEDLIRIPLQYKKYHMPFYMVPRVDGDFIPESPAKLLREAKYNKVDIMSGVCANEGYFATMIFSTNETLSEMFLPNYDEISSLFFNLHKENNAKYLGRRTLYDYIHGHKAKLNADDWIQIEKHFSDGFISIGHDDASYMHARDHQYGYNTYRYELQHRGENSFRDFYNSSIGKDWVAHADDLQYLANHIDGTPGSVTRPDDVFLSDIMVTLWTNFAKTGNPTPDLELGFKWEPMTSENDMRFLSLTPAPKMKEDNRRKRRELWRNLPTYMNKDLFPDRFISNSCCN